MSDESDQSRIESRYRYEIIVSNNERVERYFADLVDLDSDAFVSFEPLFEISGGREREVSRSVVLVPYHNIVKIIHRVEEADEQSTR